jgi:acetylornithine deacetylase
MELFSLTRALVDIESITGNEERAGQYLYDYLAPMAARHGGRVERIEVEPRRYNVLAVFGDPVVTLSTHMDTVPPFFASREDGEHIWGRATADTKGIIAAMIKAAEALLAEGGRNFALLFVVGEERNSAGAFHASRYPIGSRYLINGEPTENRLAVGSKGALRFEVVCRGRMAHSAYPELGESAIEKLLDALGDLRRIPLPVDGTLGDSTMNIGTIQAGRAPNVIPDEAKAEVFVRLVGDSTETKRAVARAVDGRGEARIVLEIPAVRLGSLPGFETMVAKYTTDIPAFNGTWGEPFLIGPGSIHVAHTLEERVPKRQLVEAVEIYQRMVKELWNRESR